MSLNSFLGRQFSHEGRAGRLEFFAYFVAGLVSNLILIAPFLWVSWEYINASIDFGPDVALMMSEEDEFTFFAAGAFYVWLYVWSGLLLALGVAYLMTLCRRLSDIGWSKWWVLVIGLPFCSSASGRARRIRKSTFTRAPNRKQILLSSASVTFDKFFRV